MPAKSRSAPAAEAKKPRRGRPRSISREAILDTAITLTEKEPGVPLSLAGVARAVGMTPMAIYTYFENKDAMLQALTDRMLSGLDVSSLESKPPIERVIGWARMVRAHFQIRPQLTDMLVWEGGHGSIAWLNRSAPLATALADLGLKGDEQARTLSWLWGAIMGAIHYELRVRAEPEGITSEEIAAAQPEIRTVVENIQALAGKPGSAEAAFEFELDRLCDGLKALSRP